MEARRHNGKIDDQDDDRNEVSSLRPASRDYSRKEHNQKTRMQGTLRPFTGSNIKACNRSAKLEDRKVPSHIHINDEEEEEKQDVVTSRPSQQKDGKKQHKMRPGAMAIHGPGFSSSDQSIAGTILVGDQIPCQDDGTTFVSHESTSAENQSLVIAAEVAPTEADMVTRMEHAIESRVRNQLDQFLQQTPRAETVNLETSTNDDMNESLEVPASFREGVDVNAANEPYGVPAKAQSRLAHSEPARKKRLVCLLSILAAIIIIVVGITVAVFLSRSSSEDDNELVLQCSATSPCNLNHAVAICTNGECVIGNCESSYDDCNSDANDGCEVNLETDLNHCGSCNNMCDLPHANSKCMEQQCIIDNCSIGFADCDGNDVTGCETNLQTDKNNCGSCSNVCNLPNGDSQCFEGECILNNCTDGYASCDGESPNSCEVNLQTDLNHCGSCNNLCDLPHANSKCVGQQCLIESCSIGFADCDGNDVTGCETNLQTDKNNCGSCSNACDLLNFDHAVAICTNGECVIDKCQSNYDNCNSATNDGCEVNLETDLNHCGSCNNLCDLPHANSKCVAKQCAIESCSIGFGDCDGIHVTGCETNLQTDKNNCGSCSNVCNLPNENSNCVEGECVLIGCADGYASCDGESPNSCEVNLETDLNHCGSCNNLCDLPHANSKCVAKQCAIESCSIGFGDCDGIHVTGCETNLQTDKNNCGSCSNVCNLPNENSNCVEGECVLIGCADGYASCDGESPNSCEVDLQTDKDHCGFCDNPCNLSNAISKCIQGICTVDTCVNGYGDCDGKPSTGCELDLLSSKDHCGSCNNKCSAGDSCTTGVCVTNNVQRSALMSLYESTNGPNWNTDAQTNWGLPGVNECEWHGVMCRSGKVTHLNKNNGNLTGKIPTDVGLLTELTNLDLYGNFLSGQIPSAFGSLTKLTWLSLSYNELTGTIPTEMGRLTRLDVLSSSANRLTGTLPPEIASSTKLSRLFLSRNELTGTIPIEIGSLTNLEMLWLSTNQLTGTLPSEIANMTKLTSLWVLNNNLASIPTEICNMDLSEFIGDCPPCSLGCCTECY